MRRKTKSDILNSIFLDDPLYILHEPNEQNPNFHAITAKAAKVQTSPKGRHYIKAGTRIYLESLCNFSSLEDGKTYIFSRDKKKVKRLLNWV